MFLLNWSRLLLAGNICDMGQGTSAMITSQTVCTLECKKIAWFFTFRTLQNMFFYHSLQHSFLLKKNCNRCHNFIQTSMKFPDTWTPMMNNIQSSSNTEVYLNLSVTPLEPDICNRYLQATVFWNLQFAGYECHAQISSMWSLQIR